MSTSWVVSSLVDLSAARHCRRLPTLGQVTARSKHGATVAQRDSSGATSRNILCRGGRIGRVTDLGQHIRAVRRSVVENLSGEELGTWDDPGTPVLAIGVERFSRGVGVGRLLMTALIEFATTLRVPAVNLTTGTFNEVAVYLYHSRGFKDVAQQGEAVKMRLALANKPEPPVHDHPTQRGQTGPEGLRSGDSAERWWQLQ
jgi:GNAT superfamily N-acetyltransferase